MQKTMLDIIEETVDIETFLSEFNIDVSDYFDGTFRGSCPIHGGDNNSAFAVYKNQNGRYCWACHTNDCHKEFGGNLIGLISGVKKCTLKKSIWYIANQFNIKKDSNSTSAKYVKGSTLNKVKVSPVKPMVHEKIDSYYLKKCFLNSINTDYFKLNGIPKSIVSRFGLGFDSTSNRITIPVFDENKRLIGWDGRYSNDSYVGTVDINGSIITKYKLYSGLKKKNILYGLDKINFENRTNYVILVEGFKDVWKLNYIEMNAASVFGHSLSAQQLYLLKNISNNVVICFDNDEKPGSKKNPGQKGAKNVLKILSDNKFNVKNIVMPINIDIGDGFKSKRANDWIEKNILPIKESFYFER